MEEEALDLELAELELDVELEELWLVDAVASPVPTEEAWLLDVPAEAEATAVAWEATVAVDEENVEADEDDVEVAPVLRLLVLPLSPTVEELEVGPTLPRPVVIVAPPEAAVEKASVAVEADALELDRPALDEVPVWVARPPAVPTLGLW